MMDIKDRMNIAKITHEFKNMLGISSFRVDSRELITELEEIFISDIGKYAAKYNEKFPLSANSRDNIHEWIKKKISPFIANNIEVIIPFKGKAVFL